MDVYASESTKRMANRYEQENTRYQRASAAHTGKKVALPRSIPSYYDVVSWRKWFYLRLVPV